MEITSRAYLRQSSHLFVVVCGGGVSLLHIVADYEGGGSFSNEATFPLPSRFSLDVLDDFLRNILLAWQDSIEWKLIDCEHGICINSDDEESGINGSTLIISPEYYQEDYFSSTLSTKAVAFDSQSFINGMASYFTALGASDLIAVNIDWDGIKVLGLCNNPELEMNNICVKEFSIDHNEVFGEIYHLLSKVSAMTISKEAVTVDISNVFHKRPILSTSTRLWDLLRSYITIKLFDLNDNFFRNFGLNSDRCHLIIGGDMISLLPQSQTVLAVIDGLQLRGRYNIAIDQNHRFTAGCITQRDMEFICPLRELYPRGYLYLSTEKGGSGAQGKISYQGKIVLNQAAEETNVNSKFGFNNESRTSSVKSEVQDNSVELILGQVGNIYTYETLGTGKLYIKPEKDVYFPGLEREGDYLVTDFNESIKKVIIDCRKIPVVYGPDIEANASRVRDWLGGLNLR